jgi:hypothetical protein
MVGAGAAALSGCMTVNSGDYGVALDDSGHPRNPTAIGEPMKISAGELGPLSSLYFGVVEVTFENTSPAWIQIDHIDLDFGTADKNKSVFVPWGDDIETWKRAAFHRPVMLTFNDQRLLGWPPIGEPVVGAAAGGRMARAPGGTVALEALPGLDAEEPETAVETTRAPPRFPSTHLLSLPLRIPPGLFARRWLLLNTAARPPGGCIDSFILSYETADHVRGHVLLKFRATRGLNSPDWQPSQWQIRSCEVRPIGAGKGSSLSARP